MTQMDDTLATLAAERAIRRLVAAYCDAVGRRDADAAGRLFAPDAQVHIMEFPKLTGREAITQGMHQSLGHFSFMHQRGDTGLIDVEGDRARARVSILEINRPHGAEGLGLIFGWYEDQYALLDEGWRFHRRRFELQMRTMVPISKIQELPDTVPDFAFSA